MIKIVVIALLCEAVWETLKMIWQSGKFSIEKLGILILGILIALGSGIDLLALVGIPMQVPYLGMILTGILISRGSNYIHDLTNLISSGGEK